MFDDFEILFILILNTSLYSESQDDTLYLIFFS